jgi:hypothetical protein
MRRFAPALPLVIASAVTLALAAGASGCKSKPQKICANLEAIMAKEEPSKKLTAQETASCVADIELELAQCENAETIAACYVEATTLDAVATCESKCQKKPAARVKPGGSAAPASSN